MTKTTQLEIALDMLDFSGGLLMQKIITQFWQSREYNLDDDTKGKVFLTAYQLTKTHKLNGRA